MTKAKSPKKILLIILLFFTALSLLLVHTRGFIAHDEGWVVNPAYRTLSGEIPYKDFHFIYFPGSLFLTAGVLSVWKSILALRLVAMIFSLLSIILIYKISFSVSRNIALSLLSSAIFFLFLPATINYLAPTPLAICMSLLTIYLLFVNKATEYRVFLAGLTTVLAMLFKQNFGVALVLVSIIGVFLSEENKLSTYKSYFIGTLIGLVPIVIFFLLSGSLSSFFNDMHYFVIEKTLGQSLQVTPFIPPGDGVKLVLKIFFYTLPFAVSLIAIILAFKKNKELALVPIFVMLFYIFGIRPTTDYIHLAPLLAVTGLSFAVIYSLAMRESAKTIIYIAMVCLVFVGFFTVGFWHYYRWDSPLKDHGIFLSHPRVLIFGNDMAEKSVRRFGEIVRDNRKDNSYLYTYDYMPMYYFLTDSKNPTHFDFIPPLTESEEKEIVRDLESSNTRVIVSYSNLEGDKTTLGRFIKANFVLIEYPPFFAWVRN